MDILELFFWNISGVRQLLRGMELYTYKSDMASFNSAQLSWLLSIFGIKSWLWTMHADSKPTILMWAEQPARGAGCCMPPWLLRLSASKRVAACKKRDAANVCYMLFSLSAFPLEDKCACCYLYHFVWVLFQNNPQLYSCGRKRKGQG